ncbi:MULTISPECIES: hypothetical protein [Corynebacterium]|uniref:hypothetical protein n=1 Tax=Corynebacterium TaxID=1716 RepID=UPI00223A81D2|nr:MULTISPECIES: hypothetical protein [Corynebacterium]MCT2153556.1 hypothetical protein [Corynebacterium sanguinis]WNI12544.1 hypothetical protein RIU96_10045 [Corynebacterium sp. Z-1]
MLLRPHSPPLSPWLPPAHAAVIASPIQDGAADATVALKPIGSYNAGVFDESTAEIVA